MLDNSCSSAKSYYRPSGVIVQDSQLPELRDVLLTRVFSPLQRMKNYTIYAVSITIRIVLGFLLLALIWKFDFPPFMVLIIAILNDGEHALFVQQAFSFSCERLWRE
jgi:hypothetical protein